MQIPIFKIGFVENEAPDTSKIYSTILTYLFMWKTLF